MAGRGWRLGPPLGSRGGSRRGSRRGSRPGGLRVSAQTAWAASIACTALVGAALVVTGADGFQPSSFDLSVSSTWLPSFKVGQVALVDGTTADTVARVPVVRGSGRLDVVQTDSNAVVVDRTRGTVTRVDGATLDTPSSVPFGGSTTLRAFPGRDVVYVYDWDGGNLATLAGSSLAVVRRVALDRAANPDATLVDAAGRFWVIGRSGAINRYDALGNRTSSASVAAPAQASLVTVGRRTVVVDPARSQVRELDPETGELGDDTCVGGAGHRLFAGGSPTRDVVYFTDGQAGSLLTSDLGDRSCAGFVQVSAANSDLGAPVEAAGHVFIANRSDKTVVIVNPITGRKITAPVNVVPGEPFDLFTRSGIVWYNQPNTERAGVIGLDGTTMEARKYDPKNPNQGLPGQDTETTSSGPQPSISHSPAPGHSSATVTSGGSASPSVNSDASTTGGPPNLKIGLDAPSSPELNKTYGFMVTATGGRLVSATWNFGDRSRTASGFVVTHAFTQARTFMVTVTGRFEDGSRAQASIDVTVHAKPVVEIVSIAPSEVDEDVPVQLTATFKNGPPESYTWRVLDPDNKVVFTSNDASPTYTFLDPTPDAGKPYLVSLVVDGQYGGERGQNVTVGPAKPTGVAVECGRTSLVAGETIRCNATGNGAFLTWTWTITGPDGVREIATGEASDVAAEVTAEGDYTVQAVAANRTGRSDPSPAVHFAVRQTAFKDLECTPSTVRAEEPVTCSIAFVDWSDYYRIANWKFSDGKGHEATAPGLTAWDVGKFLISPTFPEPGTYSLEIWYYADWFVYPKPLNSGTVEVGAASRDVKVSVTDGQVKEGSDACSSECTWTYSDGDKVVLRATAPDGSTLSPAATVTWTGCKPASDQTRCTLTVGKGSEVSATVVQPARLELSVRGANSDKCGDAKSAFRASGGWRAVDPADTTTTTDPPPPPTTTTTEPKDPDPEEPDDPTPTTTTTTKDPCSGLGRGEISVSRVAGTKTVAEAGCAELKTEHCLYEHKASVTWKLSDAKPSDNYKVSWHGCDSVSATGTCTVKIDGAGNTQKVTATFK